MVTTRVRKAETPALTYVYEPVTPEQAETWLAGREVNIRGVKRTKLNGMVRDMRGDRWVRNGETIKIAPNGELLDGMHRMMAVVEADLTIWFDVVYNVPIVAMPTIDTGSARTFGDVLKLDGETDTLKLAAVVKRLLMWKQGHRLKSNVPGVTPSHAELELFFGAWKAELRLASARGNDFNKMGLGNATSAGTAYFLFCEIDYDQANTFFDALIEGANIGKGNPVYALRQRLIKENAKAHQRHRIRVDGEQMVGPPEQLALIIHAWNFWRKDETVDTLHVVYGASGKGSNRPLTSASFPVPL